MRKTLTTIGMGASAVASLLLLSAPSASAATTHTFYATESVKIRAKTTTNSSALGLLPKGANAKALMNGGSVMVFSGGKHNACGSKGYIQADAWNKVTYKGITGYVPHPCMMPR
ncbi:MULTISPECIES: hypothetical protein [unclassified Streptomyces]|uniref:hypothetical protein n=1 Tax=unclassified Streptomyces TaxID=2593676 RepID=UPI00037BC9E8|nr:MULTISPECIES: hypothetical protein [unclassified Streptomyces]MYT32183.1 hypothetical protein [Streptomyces sp. SID8354]